MSLRLCSPSSQAACTADPALRMTSLGSAPPNHPPVILREPRAPSTQHQRRGTQRFASCMWPLPRQMTYSTFAPHHLLPRGNHACGPPPRSDPQRPSTQGIRAHVRRSCALRRAPCAFRILPLRCRSISPGPSGPRPARRSPAARCPSQPRSTPRGPEAAARLVLLTRDVAADGHGHLKIMQSWSDAAVGHVHTTLRRCPSRSKRVVQPRTAPIAP